MFLCVPEEELMAAPALHCREWLHTDSPKTRCNSLIRFSSVSVLGSGFGRLV